MSGFYCAATRGKLMAAATAAYVAAGFGGFVHATPYASNVVKTGLTVNFILNEDADALEVSINGGAFAPLGSNLKGPQSFLLGNVNDTFSIRASKNDSVGYKLQTGLVLPLQTTGLSQPTVEAGLRQISDDTNNFNKYNSPRGISINNNPNTANFGTAYISNSAAGAVGGRTLVGEGLYAVRADQTDAFGYGDTAQGNATFSVGATANTPFRTFIANNGEVYVAGFGDAVSGVWRMSADLLTIDQVLNGNTGPAALPVGQNHGSVTAQYVTGSTATNDLTLWTLDEDLTTNHVTGAGSTTDKNALWQYNIGGSAFPYTTMPTKVNTSDPLVPLATSDMERGADGKWYLGENRAQNASTPGLIVLDSGGNTAFSSLTASNNLGFQFDVFSNVFGMAVSPDQQWLACAINPSDVAVIPLVNGIPDISRRMLVNSGTTISNRDIAFDAAGNIHWVTSGHGLYRVLSTGGQTVSTTAWNGTSYAFNTVESGNTLYWDIDGATPGGGGAAPAGTWDSQTLTFNTDPTGGASGFVTAATGPMKDVVFTAGTDGSGTYTVNVSNTQLAKTISIARGNVTLSGGTVGALTYDVANLATGTIDSGVVMSSVAGGSVKSGAGPLTINGGGNTTWGSGLTISTGTVNLARTGGSVFLGAGSTITVNPGATLNLSDGESTSTGTAHLHVLNNSTTSFNTIGGTHNVGNITGAGNSSVSGASILNANLVRQNALSIADTSVFKIRTTLNTGNGGTGAGASVLPTLPTVAATAQFNLNDSKLIVQFGTNASPVVAARAAIILGRGGTDFGNATWQGTGGIASDAAAVGGTGDNSVNQGDGISFAIGYVENSFLPALGLASYTSFGGQTVDSGSLLIRFTRGADCNLDGKVNTDDVTIVGATFGTTNAEWSYGDFDYDGVVDSDDVTVLGALYDATAPALSQAQLSAQYGSEFAAAFARGQAMAAVPEPSAVLVLGLGVIGALWQRRRRGLN